MDISLGMEDGAIPDAKITASSWTTGNPPHRARLYSDCPYIGGAWCPFQAAGSYLQVDLGALHHVTAIATQGNPSERGGFVTEFIIQHSTDGQDWCCYEENGQVKVRLLESFFVLSGHVVVSLSLFLLSLCLVFILQLDLKVGASLCHCV